MKYPLLEKLKGRNFKHTTQFYIRAVERLLNTRCNISHIPEYGDVKDHASFLSYGIRDFSNLSVADPNTHRLLARHIETQLLLHETWLQSVHVSPYPDKIKGVFVINFQMDVTFNRKHHDSDNIRITTTYNSNNFSFYNTNCLTS